MRILTEAQLQELAAVLRSATRATVRLHEHMAAHTSFRIGGPADVFVIPQDAADVRAVLRLLPEDCPLYIIGNGTNLLVRDNGIRGVVVQIAHCMNDMQQDGDTFTFGAGYPLAKAARMVGGLGYTGMEFAAGIPGSIGGGVFMNAGAYGGELSQVVTEVETLDAQGNRHIRPKAELGLGYRRSAMMENGEIVCAVTVTLVAGDKAVIAAKMAELQQRRVDKQPLDVPSAGSTFKRPLGHFAGALIEQCGLKGYAVGPAQVSPKHAGFVVNNGGATAAQVLQLMQDVQDKVFAATGVKLEPEVRILGDA